MEILKLKVVEGKETETTIGVWRCPHCRKDQEVVLGREKGPYKCFDCQRVIARTHEELKHSIIEKKVGAYVCPLCNETVPNTSPNWCGETTDGAGAVMCPRCLAVLNGRLLIHHGESKGEFEPRYHGTDYFAFRHKPCQGKENNGFCVIYAALVDNQGRIIFNLECHDCGRVDALKTHTFFLTKHESTEGKDHTVEAIHLDSRNSTLLRF